MKRLLLGPALLAPLALFGCSNWGTKAPELPKVEVPEVVRQIPLEDFEHFPQPIVPAAPSPEKHTWTHPAPTHSHAHARTHARPPKPSKPVVKQEPAVQADPLPPQQGPICIFPLNMIPNCTPQAVQ